MSVKCIGGLVIMDNIHLTYLFSRSVFLQMFGCLFYHSGTLDAAPLL